MLYLTGQTLCNVISYWSKTL